MNRKIAVTLIASFLIAMGCTTPIKYDLTDLNETGVNSSRQSIKVAITPFEDLRPVTEKNAPSNFSAIQLNDRAIEGDNVAKSISEALASHFNHVKLFQSVDVFDEAGSEPTEDVNKRLYDLGYQAVLTGKVKHFHSTAYTTTLDKVAPILAFFVPVSAIVTIPMVLSEKNTHDTNVEIIDVKLTETRTGKVLWSGSYVKKPQREYADAYCVQAASDTLKDIALEMVDEIEKVNFDRTAKR